jgi:serine/threonine protein kinase
MRWLSDAVLVHLSKVAGGPDVNDTRYELVEKIGQGGMGTVFRAHDRELDRDVALKVLHALPDGAQASFRLAREARLIARLEHPGIVPVHDTGRLPDGRLYYVMKLVRGKRLDEQVGPATSLAERLGILQKICEAIAFAHANGVLHRDLKPQNVMVGPFGEVLVLDWGVAKERGADLLPTAGELIAGQCLAAHTAAGTVVGTPGYMAPEQTRGELTRIDERTDVYALGGILYYLLTGQAPDDAPPRSPRSHDRSIPRPVEAICLKALAPQREARYAGVAEMTADIAHFLAGERVQAYPEGLLGTTCRLALKYRTILALILAYLIMRALLLLFAGF